jgi:hypothetical protein
MTISTWKNRVKTKDKAAPPLKSGAMLPIQPLTGKIFSYTKFTAKVLLGSKFQASNIHWLIY